MTTAAPPASRPAILDRLRDATASRHAAVEHDTDVLYGGRERYAWFLERQYGFVAALEPRLATAGLGAHGLDLAPRLRADRFEHDLRFLGREPAAVPRCDPAGLPDVSTPARAFGAVYVLEGSTLGGAFILRKLGPALGVTARDGASALAPHGERVRERWFELALALDAFVRSHPEDEAAVLSAACDTFDRMHAWFRAGGPPPGVAAGPGQPASAQRP